jgi:hypothetical protein
MDFAGGFAGIRKKALGSAGAGEFSGSDISYHTFGTINSAM